MKKYEITLRINNSFETVKIIESKNEYTAISECRELLKQEYDKPEIWFINLKHL